MARERSIKEVASHQVSVKHMGLVFEHLKVKPAPKLVALVLADHANADGVCWPSYKRIAQYTGMDKRTIQRHVKALIEMGVVSKLRTGAVIKKDGKTLRVSNAYRVHERALIKLSTDAAFGGGSVDYLESDKNDTKRVGGLSTKPLKNHHLNNHKYCGNVDNSREPSSIDNALDDFLTGLLNDA